MKSCEGFKFHKEHVWVNLENDVAYVGISDYAQNNLSDIVYLDISSSLKELVEGQVFCSIESVKSISEVFAPVSGKVIKINDALLSSPELMNKAPYENWIVSIEPSNDTQFANLMTEKEYDEYCKNL